jgi:spermidine/putrescine transport system permease protein
MSRRTILLAPGLGFLALFLVLPCLIIFAYSLFERGTYGGIVYDLTAENYGRVASALFARIFLDSVRIAGTATIVALLIGYPPPTRSPYSRATGRWRCWCWRCCRSGATT